MSGGLPSLLFSAAKGNLDFRFSFSVGAVIKPASTALLSMVNMLHIFHVCSITSPTPIVDLIAICWICFPTFSCALVSLQSTGTLFLESFTKAFF